MDKKRILKTIGELVVGLGLTLNSGNSLAQNNSKYDSLAEKVEYEVKQKRSIPKFGLDEIDVTKQNYELHDYSQSPPVLTTQRFNEEYYTKLIQRGSYSRFAVSDFFRRETEKRPVILVNFYTDTINPILVDNMAKNNDFLMVHPLKDKGANGAYGFLTGGIKAYTSNNTHLDVKFSKQRIGVKYVIDLK